MSIQNCIVSGACFSGKGHFVGVLGVDCPAKKYPEDWYKRINPSNKILHVVRDPRIKSLLNLSYMKIKFNKDPTVSEIFKHIIETRDIVPNATKIKIIRYEDYLSEPREKIKEISEFFEYPLVVDTVPRIHNMYFSQYDTKLEFFNDIQKYFYLTPAMDIYLNKEIKLYGYPKSLDLKKITQEGYFEKK